MTFRSLLFLLFCLAFLPLIQSELDVNYYQKTCPKFKEIVQKTVIDKQQTTPTTAAAALRLFFHDCMLGGCDASVLVSSNAFNTAERDADINLSLPGDGFDVVARAKNALELECPGVVSCADVLAEAARDLVVIVGGPFYEVRLGRRDGLESKAKDAEGKYPKPTMTLSKIISIFASKGFSLQEMVALSGAHTIGFSHCSQFSYRIFNFSKTSASDPAMNSMYVEGLKKLCANASKDPGMSAFNDVMTPGKFDNMYYRNLQRGLGLLATDTALWLDKRTKSFVDLYAANQNKFFQDFANAMIKVSNLDIKTGNQGEIRHRCDTFNSLQR
ncbi:peroxidase 31-like [Prosopis cineraria]|uniref:peroxidase 31-like n=1 Tax=Prosopis cineraria TaxID=364024 RepID=UPI00240F32CF|nr:peroxidase 31-like [Prosopis cineraria]